MTGPRALAFPGEALRVGERQEDYLLRRAVRLLEVGFTGEELVAALIGLADQLPNRSVSDSTVRRVCEVAAKFADPSLADPFANVADLTAWREAAAAPWIVAGLLQRGSLTLLSAKGGTGKSLVTLAIAVMLAAGEHGDFLDFRLPGEVTPVAILDAECGTLRLLRRLRALVEGGVLSAQVVDAALPNLYVIPAESFAHRAGVLVRLGELTGRLPDVRVLLVDPLRSFLPDAVEDENANVAVGRVLDALVAFAKQEDVAVLVTDHDSKAGQAARGASAKRDAAEILWHFTAPDEADSTYIEAKPDKLRDPGGPGKFAFRVASDPITSDGIVPVSFEMVEVRERGPVSGEETVAKLASVRRSIEDHYARTGGGISERKLADETGLPKSTVRRLALQLVRLGVIHRPDERSGFYPASAKPEET